MLYALGDQEPPLCVCVGGETCGGAWEGTGATRRHVAFLSTENTTPLLLPEAKIYDLL